MKLFEVLQKNVTPLSEQELKARLADFDWKYEFATSSYHQQRGRRELELLENQVYSLWKQDPERAISLWQEYCPWAVAGSVPSFILRLEAQE